MHSSGFFRIKPIARLLFKREISGSHTISDQSLLLSTIVLNGIYMVGHRISKSTIKSFKIAYIKELCHKRQKGDTERIVKLPQ